MLQDKHHHARTVCEGLAAPNGAKPASFGAKTDLDAPSDDGPSIAPNCGLFCPGGVTMLAVTRDRSTGAIVCSTRGPLDDEQLAALLQAISLVPEENGLIIDLANTGTFNERHLRQLAAVLKARKGVVSFRHAGAWRARIVNAIGT